MFYILHMEKQSKVIKTGIELINSNKIIFNDDLYISIEHVQYNNKLDDNDIILLYTSEFGNKVYEEIDVLKSGYENITYEQTVPKIEGTVY